MPTGSMISKEEMAVLKEDVEKSTGSAAGVRCSATMITSTSQVQSSSGQFEELLVPTE